MNKSMQTLGRKMLMYFALFASLCVFFWIISRPISSLCDDAFISFRYAKHFEQGAGLVFNLGERVEGYTNLLWTLILAAGPILGIPIPQFALALSILSAAILVGSVLIFSKSYFRNLPYPYISYIAPALLAFNPIFLEHLRTGLETTLFSLLTFLSFAAWLHSRQNSRFAYLTGLILGLSYLTRPEAVLWAGSFVALDLLWVLIKREGISEFASAVGKYGIVFTLIVALHVAWRLSYYGGWLPNTYYVKSSSQWAWGVLSTRSFLWSTGFLPVIAGGVAPFALRKKWVAGTSLITLVVLIYNLRMGGDHIFTGRFLVPLLPLIYITIQEFIRFAFSSQGSVLSTVFARRSVLLIFSMAVLLLYVLGAMREWRVARLTAQEIQQQNSFNYWLATCIEERTAPTDTIAVVAAGVIPYYTERNYIDMLGLNDTYIAHYGTVHNECLIGHQKTDTNYILDRKPEYILIPRKAKINRAIAAEYYMHENPRFRELYKPLELQCAIRPLRIFVRKDIRFGAS